MFRESTTAVKEAAQSAPPVVVTVSTVMGIPMQDWVYILTAVYTIIQILFLLPKIYGRLTSLFRKQVPGGE